MKSLTLAFYLFSLAAYAGPVFQETGSNSELDYGAAEREAVQRANEQCFPNPSVRVSEFTHQRLGSYGYVKATAQFTCSDAGTDTHLVNGLAQTTSPVPGKCEQVKPAAVDAIANADEQANALCAIDHKHARRISEFVESRNNCVWGGPMYRWATDYVYEQTRYVCD
jgi:hypothetical protein